MPFVENGSVTWWRKKRTDVKESSSQESPWQRGWRAQSQKADASIMVLHVASGAGPG